MTLMTQRTELYPSSAQNTALLDPAATLRANLEIEKKVYANMIGAWKADGGHQGNVNSRKGSGQHSFPSVCVLTIAPDRIWKGLLSLF
jgi:hypothetical protein